LRSGWVRPTEHLTSRVPITTLHLHLGQATIEVPEANFDLETSLTKRLKHVTEVKQELWKKWMAQVFQGQLLAKKWRKTHREIQVDSVLVKRDSMNGGEEIQDFNI
jgi:hypothetical protein